MPHNPIQPEEALRKLGKHLRSGWAKKHQPSEKSREAVKKAVREQYEQARKAERENPPPPQSKKDRDRKPPGPERS